MEHYILHKAYIPNTKVERISDTVDFSPKQFNTPKMSFIDATFNTTQDLIYALHNPEPKIPLVKLVNSLKELLIYLVEIFIKATPPAVPPRVPVKG